MTDYTHIIHHVIMLTIPRDELNFECLASICTRTHINGFFDFHMPTPRKKYLKPFFSITILFLIYKNLEFIIFLTHKLFFALYKCDKVYLQFNAAPLFCWQTYLL